MIDSAVATVAGGWPRRRPPAPDSRRLAGSASTPNSATSSTSTKTGTTEMRAHAVPEAGLAWLREHAVRRNEPLALCW